MHASLLAARHLPAEEKICVLGFGGGFGEQFLDYSQANKIFNVKDFDKSFDAFHYLEETLSTDTMPGAVICSYDYLKQEQFAFAKNIKHHKQLRRLPLLIVCKDNNYNPKEIMELGADDVLDSPSSWKRLEERIQFFKEYKPVYLDTQLEGENPPSLKIPFAKRAFDVFIAGSVLLFGSPFWLLIALLIKLDSEGEIIYKSKRVGTGYQIFDFLKFRSMRKDADKMIKDMAHLSQYDATDDKKGSLFLKFANDPRITTIGKFLRKTSLDEIPQLINVLRGEMSIVGNRPLPLYEAKELTQDDWAGRFMAPAGCTGLWQVSKRGKAEMSTEERIQLDITYAENQSFWYDLKILLKTPFALIQKENV